MAQRQDFAQINGLSVVLQNVGLLPVTGVSVHWEWVDAKGMKRTDNQRSDGFFMAAGPVLESGSAMILSPGIIMWDRDTPHTSGGGALPGTTAQNFMGASHISATLDAAILSDGTLIGPDQYGFVQYLKDRKAVATEVANLILNTPSANLSTALNAYLNDAPVVGTTQGRMTWRSRLVNDALRYHGSLQTLAGIYINLPDINIHK